MRALVVDPGIDFSVGDVYRGLCKGLRQNGVTVAQFSVSSRMDAFARCEIKGDDGEHRLVFDNLACIDIANQMLRGAVLDCDPHVVIVISAFFISDLTLKVLRARRYPLVGVMTEQPYETQRELAYAAGFDHVALNDPLHIDRFAEACPNVWYQPHSFDPDIHYPGDGRHDFDAYWAGTAYQSRCDWLETAIMDPRWPRDCRLALAGNWKALDDRPDSPLRPWLLDQDHTESCVSNQTTADHYRRAAMSWNTYRREREEGLSDEGWAVGPREIELAACETFFARESRPEGDALFPMLPIVDDPAEFGDVVAWSMRHPDARSATARLARAAVADRTFAAGAASLLRHVGI